MSVRSLWSDLWCWIFVAGVLSACMRPPPPPAAVGLRGSVGSLEGEKDVGRLVPMLRPFAVVPLGLTAYFQGTAYDRLWGGVYPGVHRDRFTDGDQPSWWQTSIGLGVEGGVDIVNLNGNRFGVFLRTGSELGGEVTYTELELGFAYRR